VVAKFELVVIVGEKKKKKPQNYPRNLDVIWGQ